MTELAERRVQKFMDDLFEDVARAYRLRSGDLPPEDQLAIDQCTRTMVLVLNRYIANNSHSNGGSDAH